MSAPSAPATPSPDDPALASVLEPLRSLLIPGEQLEAYAVQRRIFALLHRRVAIGSTTGSADFHHPRALRRVHRGRRALAGPARCRYPGRHPGRDAQRDGVRDPRPGQHRGRPADAGIHRDSGRARRRRSTGCVRLSRSRGGKSGGCGTSTSCERNQAGSSSVRRPRLDGTGRVGPLTVGASRAGKGHAAEGTDYRRGVRADQGEDRRRAVRRFTFQPLHLLAAATTRHAHPARNATPPRGVMAPSHRMPDSASAYRLPEKRIVPARKSQPAHCASGPGQRVDRPGHRQQSERVIHLVAGAGLEHGEEVRRKPGPQRVGAEGPCSHSDQRRPCAESEEEPLHRHLVGAAGRSSPATTARSAQAPRATMISRNTMSPAPTAATLGGGGPKRAAA